jgi:hypothetical protein
MERGGKIEGCWTATTYVHEDADGLALIWS